MTTASTTLNGAEKRMCFFRLVRKQKSLVFMTIPIFIYLFIFHYYPLWGLSMAFQRFKPGRTFAEQKWIGFDNFQRLFSDSRFIQVIRNTLAMSMINLILGFVTAILLAILLNELRNLRFKRLVQTLSYLPHFLSWIIVTGFIFNFLATSDGLINNILVGLGMIDENIPWLGTPRYFWWIVGFANVWKEVGWNSIIYLAAIAGISVELYEAAYMDGANRFQRIIHITLPGIKSTVVILLIMNLGFILNAGGFEVQYLLGNGIVRDVSETIDIFVLKYGIGQSDFSYATAAGMFKSVVSIIMILGANEVAKRLGEERLI